MSTEMAQEQCGEGPQRRRTLGDERGLTLLELLVALLVVSVMMAIAIPTLQGFQDRARDRAVQTHLRDGLVLERAHWQETGDYTSITADLSVYDPTANFWDPVLLTDHPMLVLDTTSSGQRVCLAALSDSGTWYGIFDDSGTGKTYYGSGLPVPCTTGLTATYTEGGW